MQSSALLLLSLCLCAAVAVSSAASSCYVCNSLVDPNCDSKEPPRNYLVNCSEGRTVGPDTVVVPNAQVCWKQYQTVLDQTIVDKTCGPALDGALNCYDRVGTKRIKVTYCVCNVNGCNSSGRAAGSASIAALFVTLTTTLMLLRR